MTERQRLALGFVAGFAHDVEKADGALDAARTALAEAARQALAAGVSVTEVARAAHRSRKWVYQVKEGRW